MLLLLACTSGSLSLPMELAASGSFAALATVDVPEEGRLWVELVADGVPAQRTVPRQVSKGSVELDVLGMRADHDYTLCPVLELEDGSRVRGDSVQLTTGPATEPIPETTAYGETTGITLVAPAPKGKGAVLDGAFLVGLDAEGQVVWEYTPQDLDRTGKDRFAAVVGDELLVLTGNVETITPGGELLSLVSSPIRMHHDALQLSNGNTLGLIGDTRDIYVEFYGEVVTVTGDAIIEVDADGQVIWEWNAFDHLDTERYPGTLSQQAAQGTTYSWTHANSLQLLEDESVVLVSLRHQNQALAIERSSGDILWTVGIDGDFNLIGDGDWFTSQHATRLEGDEMLVVDNGNDAGKLSRVKLYDLDFDAGTAELAWSWDLGWELLSMGEADRLDNGNLLVTAGGDREEGLPAEVLEVSPQGEVVWGLEIAGDDFVYRGERVHWLEPVD
jgi:hypothetical protein